MHEGIDIAVSEGTPVKAAECGIVSYVSEDAGGYGKFTSFEEMEYSDISGMITLNSQILAEMTYKTLKYMKEGSRIYQLGSLSAFQPVPYIGLYGATKAFVLSFSRALNVELKKRGVKIGLITNTFSDERDFIRESELYPLFDAALISYEQGICKPAPELFRRMTELLGVEPGECLYVGDGGSRELFAAREAGMKAVQCTWFHDLAFEPHIPCPILDEFEQAGHPSDILRIAERD